MRNRIATFLGTFSVLMSWDPMSSEKDDTLTRFANVINESVMEVLLHKGVSTLPAEEIIPLLNEAEIEHKLYDCTCAGGGAGLPIQLSLKRREIIVNR